MCVLRHPFVISSIPVSRRLPVSITLSFFLIGWYTHIASIHFVLAVFVLVCFHLSLCVKPGVFHFEFMRMNIHSLDWLTMVNLLDESISCNLAYGFVLFDILLLWETLKILLRKRCLKWQMINHNCLTWDQNNAKIWIYGLHFLKIFWILKNS